MIPALRPAAEYRHPVIRRMTAVLPVPFVSMEYHFTPQAAERIVRHPQVLLHHRLYHIQRAEKAFVYSVGGRPVSAVKTEHFSPMGSLGKPSFGEVWVFAPEEIPAGMASERIRLEYNRI